MSIDTSTGWRSGSKEEVLKVIRDFPEGIGIPFIRETLRIPDSTIREYAEELVKEGLVRKEEKFVFKRPYFWFVTYYPIIALPLVVELPPELPPVIELPSLPSEFVHITLVYNKETRDKQGKGLNISLTYDFDCKNTSEIKDTLKRFLFVKSHFWLDSKFGDRIPIPDKWAEEKERPTDSDIVHKLESENLELTTLHYKWSYYREVGSKSEELEGDLEDWEKDLEAGATWEGAIKGRKKG